MSVILNRLLLLNDQQVIVVSRLLLTITDAVAKLIVERLRLLEVANQRVVGAVGIAVESVALGVAGRASLLLIHRLL